MRAQSLLLNVLAKVGQASARVRLHSGHLVLQGFDQGGHNLRLERLLKVVWHVICQLANAVQRGESDLRVRVLQVLHHDGHHLAYFVYFVNVLTHLRESHDTCVLVSPVLVIRDRVLDEQADQREHLRVTHPCDQSVNGGLPEVHIVFVLVLSSKAFPRTQPFIVNLCVDVDHQLEDLLENILNQSFILFSQRRLSLNHSHGELHR